MAQEGMWEHVGLQRGSGKSERELVTPGGKEGAGKP